VGKENPVAAFAILRIALAVSLPSCQRITDCLSPYFPGLPCYLSIGILRLEKE